MKKRRLLKAFLALSIFCGTNSNVNAQFIKKPGQKKTQPVKTAADTDPNSSAQPDKILYDRALEDIKHARYTEGRLSLQTLINTYPDSEYLAKAKLAVADSYFKENGTSNLTQAVAEYKDFITFFPFLEEAAYAQMQVGMAHYKMMEKADRDSSQAQMAEDEFQAMLLKYPQSPLAPQAEQRLREVQEVLADGEYKIAHFYYTKQDYRASAARILEVVNRYPLYSQSDEALWMLGDIYTRVKVGSKNEDQRNYWSALSGKVYAQIVEQYPLSPRAQDAKVRLKQMGLPVPASNPDAVIRMQKERDYERQHHENALMKGPKNMIHGAPDVSLAAHNGQPNLNPPDDAVAASEVLKPNSGGGFSLSGSASSGGVRGHFRDGQFRRPDEARGDPRFSGDRRDRSWRWNHTRRPDHPPREANASTGVDPRIRQPLEASSQLPRRHPRNLPQMPQILAEPPLPRRHPPGLHPARLRPLMASQQAPRHLRRRINPPLTPRVLRAAARPPRRPKAALPTIPKTPPARRKRAPGS